MRVSKKRLSLTISVLFLVCLPVLLSILFLVTTFFVRQTPILSAINPKHTPAALISRLREEFLVLLERPVPALGAVKPRPKASEGIRRSEDKEQPIVEVVE